ncbi:MAG TPA: MBL fold metallo-hydrolase [Acidimicrobiales bacterium]|nr:MBL fold metallo-hydrolase [Acidimicrobiales bacterium]
MAPDDDRQTPERKDTLYFRQLLAGRDFARTDPIARQMVNFCYAIGDRASGEALLVDPAYGVGEVLDLLEADGMRCVGVLATHYHPDHVGGDLMGHAIEGVATLLERVDVPVHVQEAEAPWVTRATGIGASGLTTHASGDVVTVGAVPVELVHTPGHTPGSQCFSVDGRLVSGDTLFLDGCGRTDLPGGDPEEMYRSLTTRLARFDDTTVLYPGHLYSPEPSATMGDTRQHNYVFRMPSVQEWLSVFGNG